MGLPAERDHAMTTRESEIASFLTAHGYAGWRVTRLAGDASSRRYQRLTSTRGTTAVLMDWPPADGGETRPFTELAEDLRERGVSTPEILAADHARGLLLIEDLGDALFTDVIASDATTELTLYRAAVDLLVHLHGAPAPDLPPLGPRIMAEMTGLAFNEYRSAVLGDPAEAAVFGSRTDSRIFYATTCKATWCLCIAIFTPRTCSGCQNETGLPK